MTFHFSSPTEFYVEWVDGIEPEEVATKRRANDRTTGQYVIDVEGGVFIATLDGVEPDQDDLA